MDLQSVFAARLGGRDFGTVQKIFKFTLIDNAKKAFIKENPSVRVIDMGVGEPEERAPDQVAKRLYDAALVKANRIYPCNGTMPFREAAARYLQRLLSLSFDPETEIMHCIGAKAALAQIPLCFINPGDTSIETAPGYPVFGTMVDWLGGTVVKLPLTAENKFLPDFNALEQELQKGKTKTVLLNYPNNPTGATADLAFYERMVRLAHDYNFVIIQDAAYADFVYNGRYVSPFHVDGGKDVTMELFSLSKGFNMQGYRLGFVVSNPTLLKAFAQVKDNTDNGQFIAIQQAGVEALDNCEGFLSANQDKYLRPMQRTVQILNAAGIEASVSPGSFYLY
ncbi:MAG: aminotransferase class I/II-fold pyridoxal phosphate-dependent enzyme, partial [Bdellovibrionales bacterium]|nr:aminotransferase class I/II-fold pyridoxal phosphate-dependent enzyme [Bdellovibrionales bacterium]